MRAGQDKFGTPAIGAGIDPRTQVGIGATQPHFAGQRRWALGAYALGFLSPAT